MYEGSIIGTIKSTINASKNDMTEIKVQTNFTSWGNRTRSEVLIEGNMEENIMIFGKLAYQAYIMAARETMINEMANVRDINCSHHVCSKRI